MKPSCGNRVHFHNDSNIGTNETWNLGGGHGFKVQLQIVCHMLHVHHLFFAKCVTNSIQQRSLNQLLCWKTKLILKFLKNLDKILGWSLI